MCWNFSTKNHPNTPPTTPIRLFWYINIGVPKRNFENETMLSYLTQIFSSNYQMLGIPSAPNVIFHTTLNAHFAMLIRRSHTDQLPVNHLGIPDPSLPCEGGAGDGSTSSESYSLSLKLWFETILKIVHIFTKQLWTTAVWMLWGSIFQWAVFEDTHAKYSSELEQERVVSCPTRWSLYLPLARCIDHLSILSTERVGTAIY